MSNIRRATLALLALAALGLAACGGGSDDKTTSSTKSGTPASTGKGGGTIRVLAGTAPDYLDPQLSYTTQGAEADWISYTGLYTYAHKNGQAGSQVIPGLADGLPKISSDGKTYTITMRKGLVFNDGTTKLKASDFKYTIQRAIKVNWGGKSFYTQYIVGADAFDKGKAKSISGITTDDATGKITIKLTSAYGAFSNILAFPSSGVVPTGTKMSNLTNNPPPGVAPYMIKNVVPNRSFQVVRSPTYAKHPIPGVPVGKNDISVKIAANTQTEAEQVLNSEADVFDWGDTLPPSLLPQIQAKAKDRYAKIPTVSTFYFFLNTKTKPFNNLKARQAVNTALDKDAISRLASGFQKPSCYFIPEGIVGHPTGPCPYGDKPDLAKARQLVKESGMEGQKVTVWGETRSPRKEFVDYYASVLNKIGFKATPKILADSQFFPTIGNLKLNPQTGFADWNQDFPNPSDFYLLVDAKSIQDTNNQNFSQVNDPHVQSELAALNKVPATDLKSADARWKALDEYVAKKAYFAVYGQQSVPKFYGAKVDFAGAVFHPLYGTDWSTLGLK